jgi:hypothetical protein
VAEITNTQQSPNKSLFGWCDALRKFGTVTKIQSMSFCFTVALHTLKYSYFVIIILANSKRPWSYTLSCQFCFLKQNTAWEVAAVAKCLQYAHIWTNTEDSKRLDILLTSPVNTHSHCTSLPSLTFSSLYYVLLFPASSYLSWRWRR